MLLEYQNDRYSVIHTELNCHQIESLSAPNTKKWTQEKKKQLLRKQKSDHQKIIEKTYFPCLFIQKIDLKHLFFANNALATFQSNGNHVNRNAARIEARSCKDKLN